MKSRTCLSHRIPTLRAACVVVILAGCSSGAQVAPATDPAAGRMTPIVNQASVTKADASTSHRLGSPISGEVLTGNDVHVTCHSFRGVRKRGVFSASGVATGPYPGTFTAHGTWQARVGYFYSFWFSESFTISSGKRTYKGHLGGRRGYGYTWSCPTLSMNDLAFEIRGRKWSGRSIATISATSLSESFE